MARSLAFQPSHRRCNVCMHRQSLFSPNTTFTSGAKEIAPLTTASLAAHDHNKEHWRPQLAPLTRGFSNVSFEDTIPSNEDTHTVDGKHIGVSSYYGDEVDAADKVSLLPTCTVCMPIIKARVCREIFHNHVQMSLTR